MQCTHTGALQLLMHIYVYKKASITHNQSPSVGNVKQAFKFYMILNYTKEGTFDQDFDSYVTIPWYCSSAGNVKAVNKNCLNQLLQLCTARIVFSILINVRLYTVMSDVRRWLTNEKQRKLLFVDQ